ncbi:MAG: hypothetical protein WB586_00445 [Chthoniobacterales bacterium]
MNAKPFTAVIHGSVAKAVRQEGRNEFWIRNAEGDTYCNVDTPCPPMFEGHTITVVLFHDQICSISNQTMGIESWYRPRPPYRIKTAALGVATLAILIFPLLLGALGAIASRNPILCLFGVILASVVVGTWWALGMVGTSTDTAARTGSDLRPTATARRRLKFLGE